MPLVLASGSPRRREMLSGLGLVFEVVVPGIPEVAAPGEPPEAQVLRLATEKARAVAAQRPAAVVLAADTEVVLDGRTLGKPVDAADAAAMLRALCGRSHQVVGGVCVLGPSGEESFTVKTQVALRRADEAQIEWYVGTGEPLDKAGAYAIQGRGAFLVAAIGGSHSNVIGLPLAETLAALQRAGIPLPWDPR